MEDFNSISAAPDLVARAADESPVEAPAHTPYGTAVVT
jgi:hypothetical protein